MLIAFGVIAMLGTMVSSAWLVVSLLKYLFSKGSPAAIKGLKRSGSALVVCFVAFVVFAISVAGTSQSNIPVAETQETSEPAVEPQEAAEADLDVEITEADQNAEDEEAVELPSIPPMPDPRPDVVANGKPEETTVEKLSSSQEFVWIRNNQRLLKQKLKDPDSAKFANDYVSYKSGGPVVCGTVNARNSFGGYSGAERYIGMGATLGVYMASEVSDFDALWRKVC